jgi:hypothetical protein
MLLRQTNKGTNVQLRRGNKTYTQNVSQETSWERRKTWYNNNTLNVRETTWRYEYDEVFSGYQPGQLVERWENTLRTRTEMVFETLVFSPFNHLTRLIARENFIILSHRESNKSHFMAIWSWPKLSHDHVLVIALQVLLSGSRNYWKKKIRRRPTCFEWDENCG